MYKNIPMPIKHKSQITPDLNIHQTSIKNNPANTISKNIKNFTKHNIKNQFYWSILSSFPGFIFCGFGINNQPNEYRDLLNLNNDMYTLFCLEMIKRGVRTLERGAWFISIEHSQDILEETINIAREAIMAVKKL